MNNISVREKFDLDNKFDDIYLSLKFNLSVTIIGINEKVLENNYERNM